MSPQCYDSHHQGHQAPDSDHHTIMLELLNRLPHAKGEPRARKHQQNQFHPHGPLLSRVLANRKPGANARSTGMNLSPLSCGKPFRDRLH